MEKNEQIILRQFTPRKELTPYVEFYSITEVSGNLYSDKTLHCLPCGKTAINIQLKGKVTYSLLVSKETIAKENITVGGQIFEYPNKEVGEGKIKMLVAALTPYGMYRIFGIPQVEFVNNRFLISDLVRKNECDIMEKMLESKNDIQVINILETFLMDRIINTKNKISLSVKEAISIINSKAGFVKIGELCKQLNISERSLETNFKDAVGLSPKKYSRVVRINNIAIHLRNGGSTNLDQISDLYYYYDQAHFIHDFQQIMLDTPKNFMKNSLREYILLHGQFIKING
jgi:AraC-like DNA-binding protein